MGDIYEGFQVTPLGWHSERDSSPCTSGTSTIPEGGEWLLLLQASDLVVEQGSPTSVGEGNWALGTGCS